MSEKLNSGLCIVHRMRIVCDLQDKFNYSTATEKYCQVQHVNESTNSSRNQEQHVC